MVLNKKLNFEEVQSYVLIVRATDHGSPALDTSGNDSNITITVQDVNERPVFVPDTYSETISETIAPGTTVVTVTANDPDSGSAGVVMYSIVGGNFKDNFAIDMVSSKYFSHTKSMIFFPIGSHVVLTTLF